MKKYYLQYNKKRTAHIFIIDNSIVDDDILTIDPFSKALSTPTADLWVYNACSQDTFDKMIKNTKALYCLHEDVFKTCLGNKCLMIK